MENKKINVAMFSDSFYPIIGGRENVIDNLMRELSQQTNCFLLTTTFKGHKSFINDTNLPYEIHRCKSIRVTKNEYLSIIDRKTKKYIKEKIKNGQIDIIHTQTKYALAKFALKLGKKYNIPVVTSAHTNYIEQYKNQLKFRFIYKPFLNHVKNTINKCDCVFTVSKHMENLLLKMGVKTPITIIPNGNDILQYKETPYDKFTLLKKYNLSQTPNIFIFVGRITETKNLTFLLNVLKILKEKNIVFKQLFVGNGEITKFQNLAKNLRLENNCIFTGPITNREEIANLYKLSTLNLYPSIGESFGLTIREAGSMGTTSVTIANCATSEDITHNFNGFISPLNENAYAETIIQALSNKKQLECINNNAINTFNLSWKDIASQHLETYKNIIENKHKQNKKK